MNFSEWMAVGTAASSFVIGSIVWAFWTSWWLGKQFSTTRNMIWSTSHEVQKNIEAKLEYHEQHDDQRFASIKQDIQLVGNDIWDIRVRNAARDGLSPLVSRDKSQQ